MKKWVYANVLNDSVVSTLKENEIETVLDFAKYDMCVSMTSRETFFHRQTIEYRLKRVKEKTGLDPHKFYDLMKLVHSLEKVDGNM